jgi:hypothetical protein
MEKIVERGEVARAFSRGDAYPDNICSKWREEKHL